MKQYKMMANGMFFAVGEAPLVELPCILFSMEGGWYAECTTLDDLRSALERHHREPGVSFGLEEVWDYVRERPGEREYSGFFPLPKHPTQCVMPVTCPPRLPHS